MKFVAGLFEHPLTDRSLLATVGCKVRSLVQNAIRFRPDCWDQNMIDLFFHDSRNIESWRVNRLESRWFS